MYAYHIYTWLRWTPMQKHKNVKQEILLCQFCARNWPKKKKKVFIAE